MNVVDHNVLVECSGLLRIKVSAGPEVEVLQ